MGEHGGLKGIADFVLGSEHDNRRVVFPDFFMTCQMFVVPQVGVRDDKARLRCGDRHSRRLLVQHRVEVGVPGIHARGADGVGCLLREFDRGEAATGRLKAPEFLVVLGGDVIPRGAAVAGHGDGFSLGEL